MDGAQIDDDLLDLLMDMKHDLGKYIVMPVAMLPATAPDADVRDALRRALRETRTGGDGPRSATELWDDFVGEGGDALRALDGFGVLEASVARAIHWDAAIDAQSPIDRDSLLGDLRAVGEALAAMIARSDGGH